jgi:glycosyltransferase 2 family protein
LLRSVQFWIGVAISAVFIALFFRATHPREIASAFGEANYWYMIPAIGVLFVALSIRCVRWSILMRPVASISPVRLFSYAIIGYMANNLLPARAGEIVRAVVLGQRENVSRVATLGTIGVERLFDGTMLVLLLLVSSLFVGLNDERLRLIAILSTVLFVIALTAFYVLTLSEERATRLMHWLAGFLPKRLEEQATHIADSLVLGLRSVHSPRTLVMVLALSAAAWTVEAGAYAIIGLGFGLDVTFAHYCMLLAAANLAIIIPTFFGGTGPFEWAAKLVLIGAGVPAGLAAAYAIIAHAVIFIPTTILGLIILWSFGISLLRITRERVTVKDEEQVALP